LALAQSVGLAGGPPAPTPSPLYEQAKVVSSTPVVKQVQMQQRICNNQPVAVPAPNTGAGAVVGAIVGGAVGSAIGQGSGNAAATALGAVGGAILGNQAEGQGTRMQNAVTCTVQNTAQNVTVFQVVYEWGGKQYAVEMPRDPGPSITVQVAPVVAQMTPPPAALPTPAPLPGDVMPNPTATTVVIPQPYNVYPYGYVIPPAMGFYWGYAWGPRYRWGRHWH
jgi:uncharacterized protein YcfJ